MKNSLRIGSVKQIGIYLHWTFIVLLAGIIAFFALRGADLAAAAASIGLILALFGCVILHELGHALTALRFGVSTRDITIYPIGGVARLNRIPDEPIQEFWIAIAGPAVNLMIAAAILLIFLAGGRLPTTATLIDPRGNILEALLWLNVALVAFNMLPAFPMDGGRVLRALLALRLDYARATQIAANIGQGMAILFGILGLVIFNPILLFIALFVYIGAQQEAQHAMMRAVTQGVPVRQAMLTRFTVLSPDDTLQRAVEELLAASDQDFPVTQGGQVVGILTRKKLIEALAAKTTATRVGDVMDQSTFAVDDAVMLDEAFRRMQEHAVTVAPVVRSGELVGLLTMENVGELLMVSAALKRAGRPDAAMLANRQAG